MNILDIIILITLIPAVIVGVKKGFISQTISILTIIIGIWASSIFAVPITKWLTSNISADAQILKLASFAIIFTLIFVSLTIFGKIIEKQITATFLSGINKGLGGTLGALNYCLIVGVCLIAFDYINRIYNILPDTSVIDDSTMCKIVKNIADVIFPYIAKLL